MIPLRDSFRLSRLPLVTIALIAANVIVYLVAISSGGSILHGPSLATIVHYGAIPYEFTHLSSHCALAASGFSTSVLCTGQAGVTGGVAAQPATWETAFTAMFLHANLLHIAGNMTFLAVFGCTLEDRIGRLRFLGFYLLGGLAALALQLAAGPDSATPTLGASGAIAAVLGGYIVLFPRARVLAAIPFLWRVARLPAWAVIGLWFLFDALLGAFGVSTPSGGGAGVAYYAHIGGFAFGVLTVRAFAQGPTSRPYGEARTA
jgi:membrane associated rhomboid family serine protease